MSSMNTEIDVKPARLNGYRPAIFLLCLTAGVCLAAVLFRVQIRSRYWAWQVTNAGSVEQRAVPLTCLCNAGDAGRWGISVLIEHESAEVRQYGVLALQYTRSDWARESLVRLLRDPDESVRELAALGIAIQGDERVIPELMRLYVAGQTRSAVAAVLALQRMATAEAVGVLAKLAQGPGDVERRAALVDALTQLGSTGNLGGVPRVTCVEALLTLLDDHRSCDIPSRAEQVLSDLGPFAFQQGSVDANVLSPTGIGSGKFAPAGKTNIVNTELAHRSVKHTIAERAAEGLAHVTGLNPLFLSNQSASEQTAAISVWKAWIAERRARP